jgi:lipid-binding SYLF domain-containing protein
MLRLRTPALLAVCIFTFLVQPAASATREEERVADATEVLDQFLRIPEQAIPANLLARAYGVAVIPDVVKLGFGLGARHGRGVLVVRQADGSWSNPAFVALTGGSIGWQVGAQSTDIILVFKTRKGIDGIANGKLTLGADASVAAGPVGRQASAATDLEFEAEVVSYSRSRGLFAGVALEGSGVTMDRKANAAYYGDSGMTPERIFAGASMSAPDTASRFVVLLSGQTGGLPAPAGLPGASSPAGARSPGESPAGESGVVTYGMPDPDAEGESESVER